MKKSLHPYAIFDHKRQTVGRVLGILSFILGPLITSLFVDLSAITGFKFLGTFVVTSSLIYITFDWLFDHFIWKVGVVGKLLSIPKFEGRWRVTGETIDDEGEIRFDWQAEIDIVQKWDTISLMLKTDKSESYSYTATTLKLPNQSWQVSYSYSNEPNLEQFTDLRSHRGFCELVFDLEKRTATGTYFNSHGRRTNGNMKLIEIEES